MSGENLDLTSDFGPPTKPANSQRRFVGIHFACCDVYSRVYVNRDHSAYVGNCPRCAKRVELKIGRGGTSSRFFSAQ